MCISECVESACVLVDAAWGLRGCCVDAAWGLRGCCVGAAWVLRGCCVGAAWVLRGCCVYCVGVACAAWVLREAACVLRVLRGCCVRLRVCCVCCVDAASAYHVGSTQRGANERKDKGDREERQLSQHTRYIHDPSSPLPPSSHLFTLFLFLIILF